MRDLIDHLSHRQDLDTAQIGRAVAGLLDAEGDQEMKADFLRALRAKGETAGEIAGFAAALLARAVEPGMDAGVRSRGRCWTYAGPAGTGWSFSTSRRRRCSCSRRAGPRWRSMGTAASPRSRAVRMCSRRWEWKSSTRRSCCGNAIAATGLGFMFAPAYHPSFKVIAPVRKALAAQGVTTIFNILGPLLNPARPPYQLAGIFSESLLPKYAEVLGLLGRRRAWAVHGRAARPGAAGWTSCRRWGSTIIAWSRRGW